MLKSLKQATAATVIGTTLIAAGIGTAAAQGGAYQWNEAVLTTQNAIEHDSRGIIAEHPNAIYRHQSPEVHGLAERNESYETLSIIAGHPNEIYRTQSTERKLGTRG